MSAAPDTGGVSLPPRLDADPGPRPCRTECGAEVPALKLLSGSYLVVEVCESCRLRAQEQDVAASSASSAGARVTQAARRVPRKFRHLDLGEAITTHEPPSPALVDRHQGKMVIPPPLRIVARRLREWTPGGRGLLLHGPVGNGKTALLAGAFIHAHRRGLRGAWISERTYLGSLREAASNREIRVPSAAELCAGIDFIVMDELGSTEAHTAWNRDKLEDVVCQAYDEGIAIWASTNRPPDDLKSKAGLKRALGERAYDRLMETTTPIEVASGSWRRA